MSCDTFMARQIAKDGIARIIGPLLLHHNAAIRANTAGTLKDIAENGGEEAYTELIKDDIMTPLIALLKQVLSTYLYYAYDNFLSVIPDINFTITYLFIVLFRLATKRSQRNRCQR